MTLTGKEVLAHPPVILLKVVSCAVGQCKRQFPSTQVTARTSGSSRRIAMAKYVHKEECLARLCLLIGLEPGANLLEKQAVRLHVLKHLDGEDAVKAVASGGKQSARLDMVLQAPRR